MIRVLFLLVTSDQRTTVSLPNISTVVSSDVRHTNPMMQFPTWRPWRLPSDVVWYPSIIHDRYYRTSSAGDQQATHVLQFLSHCHQRNVALCEEQKKMTLPANRLKE